MDTAQALQHNISLPEDTRTDIEELNDLAERMRVLRRKISKQADAELEKALKGQKISGERSTEISDMWKLYKHMENSYNSLYKICYPKGTKAAANSGGDIPGSADLGKVRSMKSTLGDIERSTRQ